MLAFSLVGVAVNGAAALRLRRRQSLNARVAAWHLIEDVLGWVAVLVVAVTLLFVDLPGARPGAGGPDHLLHPVQRGP